MTCSHPWALAIAAFIVLVAVFGAPRLVPDTSGQSAQIREEHRLLLKSLGAFLRGKTPEDAVVLIGSVGGEGVIEGLLGLVGLVVDELAADLVLLGELREGCGAGEGVESESLSLGRGESFGRAGNRSVEGWRGVRGCMMDEHVCFLLRLGVCRYHQCREETGGPKHLDRL